RGGIAFDKLDFLLRLGAAGAHRIDIVEKDHAAQDELKALAQDILRARKNGLQRLVREQDVVVGVNNEHGFLQAAERGLELGELAGAQLLEAVDLGNQFV